MNSLKHGLSVPLRFELMEPLRASVGSLLADDCLDDLVALDLAEKIIDYERNLAHQRRCYQEFYVEQIYTPEVAEQRMLQGIPELGMLEDLADGQQCFDVQLPQGVVALILRQGMHFRRSWLASNQRNERRRKRGAKRYMKRSSNQLIKTLRSL